MTGMSRSNARIPATAAPARRRASALRLTLAAAVALAPLAGCVDNQKEVNAYRKVLDASKPPPVPVDYSHGEELTLEAALLLTNSGSEQLSIQGETYLQSLIARDRAYSAFMPTISLAPTFDWQNRRLSSGSAALSSGATGTGIGTGTGTGSTGTGNGSTGTSGTLATGGAGRGYTSANVPLAAHANLFNGFRDVNTLQANQFNVNSERNTLLNLQATVLLETAQTYYNVLLAERSVEVLSNSASYQDALVQDQRNRMQAGIAQPLDVAQSEAQAAATHAQLITSEDNVKTNRAMLAFLTNANVANAKLVDRLEVPDAVPAQDQAVRTAENERLDIRAAAEQVRVRERNLQAAIGEYYPSISLDLNYYLHRDSFPTNVEWAGLITATIPIFSAGEIRADVRNAMSLLRTAVYTEWQLIRQVRENVQIDWENLQASRRRIAELRTEVAASQEALRQARQRYTVGLAINLDVLNATTQLLSSQLNLAQESFNYKVFYLDLLRDMGKLPLPANLRSMSSAATTEPTTQETAPFAPINPDTSNGPGMGTGPLPAPGGPRPTPVPLPGQPPATPPQPATPPASAPASTQPAPFTPPFPPIDFNLQPDTRPATGPAVFPDSQPASAPGTPTPPRARSRRPG